MGHIEPDYDVVVVGAGPGGSTCARRLAERGHAVLVVDRASGSGFKVGESLLPEGVRLCHELGLADALAAGDFQPKHAARFVLEECGSQGRYPFADALRAERGSLAYQVQRERFDALLVRHAEAGGAEVRWGLQVVAVNLEADGVQVRFSRDDGDVRARFVVDATGQGQLLARARGLRRPLEGLGKMALYSHFAGLPRGDGDEAGDITVIWGEDSWTWIIPFADGTTSVGVVGEPQCVRAAGATDDERFEALCNRSASHRDLLAGRERLRPLQRAADFSYECSELAGERFLLVGDAAGFIDPIFSTGVFLAQTSAFRAAADLNTALVAGRVLTREEQTAYTADLHRAVRRFLSLVRNSYRHGFIQRAIRSRNRPGMRRAFISLLAGDVFDEDNPLIGMGFLERERIF